MTNTTGVGEVESQVRRVGLPVEGEWFRRDMRLPELWRLASMLRLFLTASRERRLVRGARLGMLCLNSSATTHAHAHTHTHTHTHTQHIEVKHKPHQVTVSSNPTINGGVSCLSYDFLRQLFI